MRKATACVTWSSRTSVAERIAIDSYREIVQYIGDKDPTTRRIFEDIPAQEEEHADDRRPAGRHELIRNQPALLRKKATRGWP